MKQIIKDRAAPSRHGAIGSDPSQRFSFCFAPVPINSFHQAEIRDTIQLSLNQLCFLRIVFVPENSPLAPFVRIWRLMVAAHFGVVTRLHTMGPRTWAFCPIIKV